MAVSERTAQRREHWKRAILQIVRTEPEASRIRIKQLSRLSMESTLSLVDELLREGLLLEGEKTSSTGAGRRATRLSIHPEGGYFIGVRFNAAQVTAVCLNFALEVIADVVQPLSPGAAVPELLTALDDSIDSLASGLGAQRARLAAIGIGAPGIVEPERGVIVRYAHIPSLHNLALRERMEARFGVPVRVEHGVRCSARAVNANPAYAQSHCLLFVQLGRGVHLCPVLSGRVYSGADRLAGEIGSLRVSGGELETLVSDDALCSQAQARLAAQDSGFAALARLCTGAVTPRALVLAARDGCPGCAQLIGRAGAAMGEALAPAVLLLNPQGIVFSGDICTSEAFSEAVRRELRARCLPESLEHLRTAFLPSDTRQDAAGAAMLPYEEFFGVQ